MYYIIIFELIEILSLVFIISITINYFKFFRYWRC